MMDIIARNPYRTLGVFANDPIKIRTANIAKIRAFNKVGKDCCFECDLVDIFGPVDRSEQAIEQAISLLSSDIDAEYYSCTWVHRTDKLDATAKAPIDLIRSGIEGKDKSSYVNVIIGALLADNTELASDYIIRLFECDEAPNDSVKERFIDSLETLSKGDYEWPPFVWWPRLKDSCEKADGHNETLEYIAKVVNKESISYLRKISETDSLKKDTNWLSISMMHILGKRIVDVIKETCDLKTRQPHAEAQIALSEYALAILKACKKYYSETRFWDAKPVEDILGILRDVYRISYSSKTKDECTLFGKKLKDEVQYLAPLQVKSFSTAIRKEIESFCERPNETRWALQLLRNCVKPLINIKIALGDDNPYYLRISTQIADNALYACQSEIESAERKYHNPKNNPEVAKNNLKRVLLQASQLFEDLSQLNLEKDFAAQKLNKFAEEIDSCKKRYDIHYEVPEPSISLQTYEELYQSCSDYQSLMEFTRKYPESIHFKEAIKRIWEIEDEAYPKIGESISTYRKALLAYKEKFPNSHNESKLISKVNELLLGSGTLGTVYEYRTMLRLWPNHPKRAIILGRLDLASFKMCHNIEGWKEYLSEFPNGKYRDEALRLIQGAHDKVEEEAFNKCHSLSDFNRFIIQYPSSKLYAKALDRIEELIYQQALSSGNYDVYLKRYPKGRYAYTLRQMLDENYYKRCKSKKDYKGYLQQYPHGMFAVEANKHIKAERQRKGLIIVSIIGLLAVAFFLFFGRIGQDNQGIAGKQTINTETKNEIAETNSQQEAEEVSDAVQQNEVVITNAETHSQQEDKNVSNAVQHNEPVTTYNPDEAYLNNSLNTGAKPYSQYFGRAQTGDNYIDFKTSGNHDYVVIIKRHRDDRYINHIYIRGNDNARLYVPDGNYDVYFYSGRGWNPDKQVGHFTGGFVKGGHMQMDGPVYLESAYLEYTLYPVKDGNLVLQSADIDNVFN